MERQQRQRGRLRTVLTRVGIAAMVSGLALVATAGPAAAHHPVLAGETWCGGGQHVVKWTIGNSEGGRPMTITAISATLGGTPYPVAGYVSPVPSSGKTFALTVLPPETTGTITLTVTGTWPGGATGTRSVSVTLVDDCVTTATTTPTTSPPTTTPDTTTPDTTTPDTTTPDTTTPDTTTPDTTTPDTTTPDTTTPDTTTPDTTTPDTTTPDTTTPDTTTPDTTTPDTTTGGNDGGTTTTTDAPPVTVGGSTAPPNPPVEDFGDPVPPGRPTGTLPFTGTTAGWALLGIGLFCIGLAMACVPQHRSPAR